MAPLEGRRDAPLAHAPPRAAAQATQAQRIGFARRLFGWFITLRAPHSNGMCTWGPSLCHFTARREVRENMRNHGANGRAKVHPPAAGSSCAALQFVRASAGGAVSATRKGPGGAMGLDDETASAPRAADG